MAFPTGWTRRCPLVIQHGQVPANQTAFPVLISNASGCLPAEMVTAGGGNAAQSDGGDIRFSSDLLGATQLPCEIVQWVQNATPSLAKAEIWVPASILTGADVTIYVWYSAGGGLSQPAANSSFGSQAVWDANFLGVYHFPDGSSLSVADSTSNAIGFTNHSATATAGQIDGAAAIASSQYIEASSSSSFNFERTDAWTISGWLTPSTASNANTIFSKLDPVSVYRGFEINARANNSGAWDIFLVNSYPTNAIEVSFAPSNIGATLYHLAVTYSGNSNASGVTVYQDGTSKSVDTTSFNSLSATIISTVPVRLGQRHDGTAQFAGWMDELKISTTVRSATWVATEYNNQSSPGSFIVAGSPGPPSTGGGLFRPSPLTGIGTGGPFFTNPLN